MSILKFSNRYTRIALTIATVVFILIVINSSNKSARPLSSAVDYIDLEKFAGEWFVISNIPYFAEKGKVATKTTYIRTGENTFDDVFESKDGSFDKPVDKITGQAISLNKKNTTWKSTFYWLINFEYEILYVDSEYTIMLLGHRSRDYGWLMSRTNTVSQKTLNTALTVFANNGYDITKFKLVPQVPAQIGNTKIALFQNN